MIETPNVGRRKSINYEGGGECYRGMEKKGIMRGCSREMKKGMENKGSNHL